MTERELTVMVLAVGGNVSHGILKALSRSRLRCRVVGADISTAKVGLYTVDRAYVSPWANAPEFPAWLVETCKAEGVRAVLSGAELVVRTLSDHAEEVLSGSGAVCLVSSPEQLEVGDDKLATCRWLEAHGFNYPRFAASEDAAGVAAVLAECGYPLVAKPRMGGGARGLIEVRDEGDLAYACGKRGYVIQEHLADEDSEYTCGCFCDRSGQVRGVIVMRRLLHEGTTVYAEVVDAPAVRAEAVRIAEALRPLGPCNIQLRVAGGRPVCFEINLRFSGTSPVRARFGFNEVDAALRHYVLGEPAVDLPVVTAGVMLRYWNEMYVPPEAVAQLRDTGCLEAPEAFPVTVEDYGMPK